MQRMWTRVSLGLFLLVGCALWSTSARAQIVTTNFDLVPGAVQTYIEGNLRLDGLGTYTPPATVNGHMHIQNGPTDLYIYTHAGCCSNYFVFSTVDGTDFTPESLTIEMLSGTSYMRAPDGTLAQVTGDVGDTWYFPDTAAWEDITTFALWTQSGGVGIDNLNIVYNAPPVPTNQSVTLAEDSPLSITVSATDAEGDPLTYALASSPSHGTLSGTAPNFTYVPNLNFFGADSFTFTAADQISTSVPGTVSILVTPVNDAPVATAQSLNTSEDTALHMTLVATDVDTNSTGLTYSISSQPSNGAVTGSGASWTYTPTLNFAGSDSFLFVASDGELSSAPASVTLTVAATPDPPVATNLSLNLQEDSSTAVTLLGIDPDVGDVLAYILVTNPSHGTLAGTAPNLTYTPVAEFNGQDSFTYQVTDGTNLSNTASVTLTVTPVNDAPVATAQSLQTLEDTSLAVVLTASDIDGDTLSYSIQTQPLHGSLTGTEPAVTYTPAANYYGTDSFTFQASDGTLNSAVQTVTITVQQVNDPPVALAGSVTVNEDSSTAILLQGSDPDGDSLSWSLTALPTLGSISGTAPNLTYTPNSNISGNDSLSFKVSDGQTDSSPATIAITIVPTNDLPVAAGQSLNTAEDAAVAVGLSGTDLDGDSLSFSVLTQPSNGTLSGVAPTLTYTPASNFVGTDSFTFRAFDGTGYSAAATVSIAVAAVNDAPVVLPMSFTQPEDTAGAVTLSGSDIDGDPLTFTVISSPSYGTLSGSPPNLTYTPNADYNGSDSFTFKASDGSTDSGTSTASLVISPVNDAPSGLPQSLQTSEDTPLSISVGATDVDGDPLTYAVLAYPTNGTLTGTAPTLTYTPNSNYTGSDSFTFHASDGSLYSAPKTVSILVGAVNDPPVAASQSLSLSEDGTVSILLSGSDVDGDALSFTVLSAPASGALTGTAPNLVYTPNGDFTGSDSLTFKANDGLADSATASVTFSVTPVNDLPIALAQTVQTPEDTPVAVGLSGSDVDGDSLTFTVLSQPSLGSLSGAPPTMTYIPGANQNGTDSFTFRAHDGTGYSAPATVTLTVQAANDAPVSTGLALTGLEDNALPIGLLASDIDLDSLTYIVVSPPGHGTLLGTAPNLVYQPNLHFDGSDSFSFKVNDGTADSNIATVTIQMTPVNDLPVAESKNLQTNEDSALAVGLAALDPDGDSLVYTVLSPPANGSLSGTAPTLTYSPSANFNGVDTFTYQAWDGTGYSAPAAVTITVQGVNDAPVSVGQSLSLAEDTSTVVTLSGTDVDGDILIYVVQSSPTFGSLSGTAPVLTYTPNPDYYGADSFSFKVNDGQVDSPVQSVVLNVTAVNDAPVAQPQSVQTPEDTPLAVALSGSDIDGDALNYTVVSIPAGGTLTGTPPVLSYVPNANFYGSDSFTFRVDDGTALSPTATVQVTVSPVNDAPVAAPQTLNTQEDVTLPVTLSGTDIDGDTLSYAVVAQPVSGVLSGTAPNLSYTPALNYFGSDSFTYKANDGLLDSAVVTVDLVISETNDGPIAYSQQVSLNEDDNVTVILSGADIDGDPLSYDISVYPTMGTLTGLEPIMTYQPNADAWGQDSFEFEVTDGLLTATATVLLVVNPVNDAPVATPMALSTPEDVPLVITLAGSDVDGDALTYFLVDSPSNGMLTGTPPNLTYTPAADYVGSDAFTFQASDGAFFSPVVSVDITISSVNDAPVAEAGGPYSVGEGAAPILSGEYSTDSDGIVANWEWDCDGDGVYEGAGIVFTGCTFPQNGTFEVILRVTDDEGGTALDTAEVEVDNLAPTPFAVSYDAIGGEGSALSFSGAATDPGNDPTTLSWDFGDASAPVSGATASHTYIDDGLYFVTLTATDDEGLSGSILLQVTVQNVDPSLAVLTGPTTGDEGGLLSWTAQGTDPGDDTLTYAWNFGDSSSPMSGDAANHVFADDGSYLVTLSIADEDGGLLLHYFVVEVANVAPSVAGFGGDTTGPEGSALSLSVTSTDPGDDTITHTWDFGDGAETVTGDLVTHIWDDNGPYSVTVVAEDEDGGLSTATVAVAITGVAPTFVAVNVPAQGDEGQELSFSATATDISVADQDDLNFTWNFGDGAPHLPGDSVTHSFADDGLYVVSVTVDDGDGMDTTETATIVVGNLPPSITSTPMGYGNQSVVYTYSPQAEDPGDEVFTWSLSPSSPPTMTIDSASGVITWTPTYVDFLAGSVPVTLVVDDNDGATGAQTWTIQVGYEDADNDGLADDWELENGFDPTDPTDALADADGDGLTTLDEFSGGTDPDTFDGPGSPTLLSPIDGDEIGSLNPWLVWENAIDPQGDELTYEVQLFLDEALTQLWDGASEIEEDASGESSWKAANPLPENGSIWWQGRAHDGSTFGEWSEAASFFVNEQNEAPGLPTAMYPVDGETVPTAEVQTHFAPAIDIDGDDLSYRLVLWADDGETVVADGNDIVIDQELAVYGIWNTAVLLEEDRWYSWSVAAVDEHGAEGPWTEPEEFFYSRANQPPQTPVWIAPLHGDTVETTSPDLVSTETLDPEAGMVWFRFEVGPTPTLDTADVHSFFVQHSGDGEATWDLLDEGIELPSNQEVYARVRAEDSEGVASPWNAIAFFVTGSNDAPDVPLLLSPGNTARIEDVAPVLAARHVDDPEGDLVTYDFVVARDEALSVILATVQGVQAGSGPEGSSEQVSWQVPVNLYDGIYWSARAVDVHGAASDWAVPNLLIVDGYVIDVDEWEEAEHPTAGCDCEASISGGGLSSLWPLLVLLMPALRRRRFC